MKNSFAYVYRIEKTPTEGLYTSNCLGRHISKGSTERQPCPYEDKKLAWDTIEYDEKHKFYFGFRNLKQIIKWLEIDLNGHDVISALYEEGFLVKRFKVLKSDMLEGSKQIAFKRMQYEEKEVTTESKIKEQILKFLKK